MSFGEYILAQRQSAGRQLKAVALSLGVSSAYWSKIERNIGRPPSDALIAKSATYFGVNSDDAFVAANRLPVDMRPHIKTLVALFREHQKETSSANS